MSAIVHEDEGIETQAELFGKRQQVLRLRQPVHALCSEVLVAQELMRMLIEDLFHVFRIVLAAQGKYEPALLEVKYAPLECQKSVPWIIRTQRDAINAFFPNDASPQRVVCVKDEHLRLGEFQDTA